MPLVIQEEFQAPLCEAVLDFFFLCSLQDLWCYTYRINLKRRQAACLCVLRGVHQSTVCIQTASLPLLALTLDLDILLKDPWVVQAYPFATDVCLSLGALFCLEIITTWPLRPVIVLHGVQHTNFCFPTPKGREGTYWSCLSLKFSSLKGQSDSLVRIHSSILTAKSSSSSCKASQRS